MNFMQGLAIGIVMGAVYAAYVHPWLEVRVPRWMGWTR